ncbi:MAG: methyltransferase domain-containing protein [Chloroflexi bacterium]|nr:methyltransferase domain-containing protein [Chloroflexota bacterium]MBI3733689.1 methyltransferase domain-containing protein [Chloroflexota bacterium]
MGRGGLPPELRDAGPRSSRGQAQLAADFMRDLALRGDERVLDIGCGDGKITAQIARRLPAGSILGVDISREMIAYANGNAHDHLHPRTAFARAGRAGIGTSRRESARPAPTGATLAFRVMDAARLTFRDEFDLIVSFAALHWISDHRPVLTGIARSLKPAGRVLMQFGGKGNIAPLVAIADALTAQEPWHPYFQGFQFPWGFYGSDEYRGWLAQAGLTVNRVELVEKETTQQGRAGFEGWIRTAWPAHIQRVPAHLRSQFIADVAERYLADCPPDAQGIVRVPMMRLEVDARKA